MTINAPSLGVYVHWPYCTRLCPYCDFNIYKSRPVEPDLWLAAYKRELTCARHLRAGPVDTVFFGGGTPSLMPTALIAAILEQIDEIFGLASTAEISLEANPEGLTSSHLKALRSSGVNRLSLGVQALDDEALRFLGRTHNAKDALSCFELVRDVFPAHSLDIIYARPGQTPDQWEAELAKILALAPDHLSLYELTIEPKTAFGRQLRRGALAPLPDDLAAELYMISQDMCTSAGLAAYEISNHARSGQECRHNLSSWLGGDYVGIGPGAHGRVTSQGHRFATKAYDKPAQWLQNDRSPQWEICDQLSAQARMEEMIILGLRLADGVRLEHLNEAAKVGAEINEAEINDMCDQGLLIKTQSHLKCSVEGRLLLDHLVGQILTAQ